MNATELAELRKTKSVKEIAEILGVSERTAQRRLASAGLTKPTDRTDIKDEDVVQLYNEGKTIIQIAEHFDCSHDTITKRLAKYGIHCTRAEGIKRHFKPTYDDRWPAIKVDLDRGLCISVVRDLHHIRMENLENLMQKNGYRYKSKTLEQNLADRIAIAKKTDDKRSKRYDYLCAIRDYLINEDRLPDVFVLSRKMNRNTEVVRRAVRRYELQEFISIAFDCSSWVSVLCEDLKRMGIAYELNNRKILLDENGHYKEMDIYIPDRNLGIEVNPVGTHSVDIDCIGITDIKYHQKKALLAEQFDVGLLHLYDEDFVDKERYQKILEFLRPVDRIKIGARQCSVKEISLLDCNIFLRRYHLQGVEHASKFRYGLYYDGILCSVLSVGKPRYTKHDFEIIRYCVRPDYAVIGGFQKLLSEFLKNCKQGDTVVSYMDLNKRFSSENIYEKSGFILEEITQPDYVWTSKYGTKTLKRYDTMKKKLIEQGFDASKTEREIMFERGFVRVYGAGSKRYVYIVQ